jgi:hypothetical protein
MYLNLDLRQDNGIHGREKRNRVVEWIKTQKCSITFFQETHLDENIENEIKNKTNFAIYCSNGTPASMHNTGINKMHRMFNNT